MSFKYNLATSSCFQGSSWSEVKDLRKPDMTGIKEWNSCETSRAPTEHNAKQTLYNYLFAFIKNRHLQSKTLISIFNFQYFQVKTAPTVEKPRSPGSPGHKYDLFVAGIFHSYFFKSPGKC